jgi:hypothetical protein
MTQFQWIHVPTSTSKSLKPDVFNAKTSDARLATVALVPLQCFWFVRWLQKRVLASRSQHDQIHKLRITCLQLDGIMAPLNGLEAVNHRIPLRKFLEFESKVNLREGDWLSWGEKQTFLRQEVLCSKSSSFHCFRYSRRSWRVASFWFRWSFSALRDCFFLPPRSCAFESTTAPRIF